MGLLLGPEEIRVFHEDRFLYRAISAELAGETIQLHDIIRTRNGRRKQSGQCAADQQG